MVLLGGNTYLLGTCLGAGSFEQPSTSTELRRCMDLGPKSVKSGSHPMSS